MVVQENSNLLYQGKINLESYLAELNNLSLSLYNNPEFINYMRAPNKEDNYLTIGIVRNVLQTILYAEDNITRVQISFEEVNRGITASKRSTVVFLIELQTAMKTLIKSPAQSLLVPHRYRTASKGRKCPLCTPGTNECTFRKSACLHYPCSRLRKNFKFK